MSQEQKNDATRERSHRELHQEWYIAACDTSPKAAIICTKLYAGKRHDWPSTRTVHLFSSAAMGCWLSGIRKPHLDSARSLDGHSRGPREVGLSETRQTFYGSNTSIWQPSS